MTWLIFSLGFGLGLIAKPALELCQAFLWVARHLGSEERP